MIVVAGLSACAAEPGHRIQLEVTRSVILVPQTDGHGDKALGGFTATGHMSISAGCVGRGTATVSLPPTRQKLVVNCTSPNAPGGQSETVNFTLGAQARFHVKLSAAAASTWTLAVAASRR